MSRVETKKNRRKSREVLLASASLLALLAAQPALAGDILRNTALNAPVTASAAAIASAQQAAAASQRAQNSLTRATQALQSLQAAQSAARALALSAASTVPNGLTTGGLEVVANPVVAAQDTTGANTWQGASAPTQTTDSSGHVDVTIKQTDSRAILSWKSFNVGRETTVTFDQQDNADWVALNRVVGNSASPSQILGTIKSDGIVLLINQNGILFGGSAQINTNSLIATTLDVGAPTVLSGTTIANAMSARNQDFLNYGLLGVPNSNNIVLSAYATKSGSNFDFNSNGQVKVEAGANLSSGDGGYILLAGATVDNAGTITAVDGQVILAAGDAVSLTEATGASDSTDPSIRGFNVGIQISTFGTHLVNGYVLNEAGGVIQSKRGSIIMTSGGSAISGELSAVINAGGLFSSTSVSRNGAIELFSGNIEISSNSIMAITPDDTGTIPQDEVSLDDFKPSKILLSGSLVDVGANSLIYAPSGDISIGSVTAGASSTAGLAAYSRIFVDTGATIDASGLKNVAIPATRNSITISPLKNNELANSPAYQDSFLNGATVTVDPRLSGVRSDGVAWIGSPLIDAKSYLEQVGVSASELMTAGGNVYLGTNSYSGSGAAITAPDVIVKKGAVIDISGGWVTYQSGTIKTTQLLTSDGRIVDIGSANLTDTYVGIYTGSSTTHASWGVTDTYNSILRTGETVVAGYTEGRDAGSLTIKSSAITLDGTVYADAFAGLQQLLSAEAGTGSSSIYGDERQMQAANSQLPAGGYLSIQALSLNSALSGTQALLAPYLGGADILVQAASDYQALADDFAYGQTAVVENGKLSRSERASSSYLTTQQLSTIELSDTLLSNSGFSQVSLHTSGTVTVAANAAVSLAAGGVFDVLAGRTVTINGVVKVPSGTIALETFDSRSISAGGSVFSTTAASIGSFDIIVNGTLSARGLWTNDYGVAGTDLQGDAWIDGGSISLYAAPRVSSFTGSAGSADAVSTDLSGSIYINTGSLVDVSSGGYVSQLGELDLTGVGGDLSLYDETSYFQLANRSDSISRDAGVGDPFRVHGLVVSGAVEIGYTPVNPSQVNSKVVIDTSAIRAQGFAGGGTFTLTTPEIAFGSDLTSTATELPLNFFSSAGFANYNITSYKTAILDNPFNNGLGGTSAVLATQTLTVGAGQTLSLTQSLLPSILTAEQANALRGLASGGDLFTVLTPQVPDNAWDSKAVNLTLGGLLELEVAKGGTITGAAGASLTVSKLLNEGTIRIAGGTITQQQILPQLYQSYSSGAAGAEVTPLAIRDLSDIFSVNADGTVDENAASTYDPALTNAQLAGAGDTKQQYPVYFLGKLEANQGVVLAAGSVTDLSGTAILNPYAIDTRTGRSIVNGRIVAGGSLITEPRATSSGSAIYRAQVTSPYYILSQMTVYGANASQSGLDLIIQPGATLDISGASAVFDLPSANTLATAMAPSLVATQVWSDAGTLSAGAGAQLTGATILAEGGASAARGGTLSLLDPVLVEHDPATAVMNVISADEIEKAGFDTLTAYGSVSSQGDVTLALSRAFILESRIYAGDGALGFNAGSINASDSLLPTVKAGGALQIDAPYISFVGNQDAVANPAQGKTGTGTVVFNAKAIDITGAVLFDRSVASATLNASGDVRLIGVQPWQNTYGVSLATALYTLKGGLAVNGDLTINAAQIYPTTGTSFAISSAKAGGTITFGRTTATTPDAPYSAGGNLTVAASNIVQGGVLRVPLGTLTLGTSAAFYGLSGSTLYKQAPATESLTLTDGSVTSVSANGLVIPYGTTTDQTEWYFSPTSADALSAPPEKILSLTGTTVTVQSGATVDISGGGDISAYEFVPGTGGSRDVLDRLNSDTYTSNDGYQYADGRQVYAIVPGLSDSLVAAYDPIYSSDYAELSSVSGVGKRVYLSGGNGLAAGWYTLLPAKYALLPGGMRVVEETSATTVLPGSSSVLPDGTLQVAGYYGDALSGAQSSTVKLFTVQSQTVVATESTIVTTTGNTFFANLASHNGTVTPQLPVDAGRLVLNPGASLIVNTTLSTAAGTGGKGAKIDLSGTNIAIVSSLSQNAVADGTLQITATSLTNLNADSLLIGGTRQENSDGTTTLNVTAQNISLQNGSASPLSAGEVVLAATSKVSVADGSVITAKGTLADQRSGAYVIGAGTGSGTGALLRVANGPERLTARSNYATTADLTVGNATLSGTAVMFDSSGTDTLATGLVISGAKYVALGAPRIGLGLTAASYSGLALSSDLLSLLGQGGAQITLRSQSSIDFADGTYSFGSIRFDAAALMGTGNGAVTIDADTISLGNAGAAGTVCDPCTAGQGTLSLNAGKILFTGGAIGTKLSAFNTTVPVTLASDTTVTLPAGTVLSSTYTLAAAAQIVVPAGTALSIASGAAILLPTGSDGVISSGAEVSLANAGTTIDAASYYFPNGFQYVGSNGLQTAEVGTYAIATPSSITLPSGTQTTLTADTVSTQTNFFAGGVSLSATDGIFAQGTSGLFDTGSAKLTLHTPYIGDDGSASAADIAFASSNDVIVDTQGAGSVPTITGVPGSAISISGKSVSISGTTINATAGVVEIVSAGSITLDNGAVVQAPGYTKVYGDSTESTTEDSPGGRVTLNAQNGDINLGTGTKLSVGGGTGSAGSLELFAAKGAVNFNGTLDALAPNGGGSFTLDTLGAYDLAQLGGKLTAQGFTSAIDIRSRTGDLTLASGESLTATSVKLTADGGAVNIAGTIDTSGVNGGDVGLYGASGVSLASTAVIDAHASGYSDSDTRQAKGGDVTLATTGNGSITIADGAAINVAATRPGERLVPYYLNGVKYYYDVEGDLGGTVTLRAPIIEQAGPDTVNISVAKAGSITGASAINLVAFKTWDLRALGAIANSGVTIDTASNTAILDPRGDYLSGTTTAGGLVRFIQDYDVSGAYANLGGLSSLSAFHAKPGVDLAFDGNIRLDRNWNFAAGTVDVAAATKAGLMGTETFTGANGTNVTLPYIVPGKDAQVFSNYVTMLYRTGGSVRGQAPVVSFLASGNLDINASINDGFFQFRDQTSADYLAAAFPTTSTTILFNVGYSSSSPAGATFSTVQKQTFQTGGAAVPSTLYVPYLASGNSASPDKTGDPFGSAVLFPLLTDKTVVDSSTLNLAAGASVLRQAAGLILSADPLGIDRSNPSRLSVLGNYTYSYGGTSVSVRYEDAFDLFLTNVQQPYSYAAVSASSTDWLSAVLARSASVTGDYTGANVYYGTAGGQGVLIPNTAAAKKIDQAGDLIYMNFAFSAGDVLGGVKLTSTLYNWTLRDIAKISDTSNPQYDAYLHNLYISNATSPTADGDFFTVVSTSSSINPYTANNFGLRVVASVKTAAYIFQKYVDPLFTKSGGRTTATVNSLVRTGVGSISLASSGTVDLTGGAKTTVAIYNNSASQAYTAQLGGAAVYTAGHPADTSIRTLTDPETGESVIVDPSALLKSGTNFSSKITYDYGNLLSGATFSTGVVGLLVSDDVYAEGGGDVSIAAVSDVLGRRDASVSSAIYISSASVNRPYDEPWRTGTVGDAASAQNTWAKINPQAYRSGVGALGGGDITIKSGRNVSDLTVTATDSLTTANVTGKTISSKALMTFGRGNVTIAANEKLLGGVVDVASGTGLITANQSISSAGYFSGTNGTMANLLRLRMSDATIDVLSGGALTLSGVSALGPMGRIGSNNSATQAVAQLNAFAFYSPNAALSLTANGPVTVVNPQADHLYLDSASLISSTTTANYIYPGSFSIASLSGDVTLSTAADRQVGRSILLMPSATGELRVLAGGSIGPASIAMLDTDLGYLPGLFSLSYGTLTVAPGAVAMAFPAVLPATTQQTRASQHKSSLLHADDDQPVQIYAGADIGSSSAGLTVSVPKQARIYAGNDILNMMFFGQNLSASDITRIAAGRDIVATSALVSLGSGKASLPTLLGNTFVIGGPGNFVIEAGRDLGPFLNSATIGTSTKSVYGGGIMSVGNEWNPWLPDQGANITVLFGVAKGANYDSLRNYYLDPANVANLPDYLFEQVETTTTIGQVTITGKTADRNKPVYAPLLITWMQQNASDTLKAQYGTVSVSYAEAYAAFLSLPALKQHVFLNEVYFNELRETADPDSVSYLQYARGYKVVNMLFPASLGYTANDLSGGSNGANQMVTTGNLDLRLATIETARGGDISILGPGGRVIAGSTVRTSAQAARRGYIGTSLYNGLMTTASKALTASTIAAIPSGFEGILTLRGGSISTFTDGDFLLNQSRLFTEQGGQIIMWSSNADLNAGQGPKTSANFPPVVVKVSLNGYVEVDQAGSTSGAGIAALQATPDSPASDVYLIAPRGTVDAGDAGVRVSGDLFVAAAHVANADNFQVGGKSFGVPVVATVDTGSLAAASNAAAASAKTAMPPSKTNNGADLPSIITVEVLGYGGDSSPAGEDEDKKRRKK